MDRLTILILAYGIVVTLSYILADYSSAASDNQYDKFWKEIVLFILITGIMFSRHRLHQSALVFALAFSFLMIKEGLIFLLTAGGHKIVGMGVVGDNNGVALALLITIPIILYCRKYSEHHLLRLGLSCTAVLGIVTVIATYSRGGFVGLIALGLMLLGGSKHRIRMIVGTAIVLGLIYAIIPSDYVSRMDTISSATSDNSFEVRLVAWKINTLIAIEHPFLGEGPYGCLSYANWIAQMPTARTWLFLSPYVPISFVAHSIYFQALGDTGFTGFVLFVTILIVALVKTSRTSYLIASEPTLVWLKDLAVSLRISLIVYMVAGAALSLLYFEPLYIILALISRCHRTASLEMALLSKKQSHARIGSRQSLRGRAQSNVAV